MVKVALKYQKLKEYTMDGRKILTATVELLILIARERMQHLPKASKVVT